MNIEIESVEGGWIINTHTDTGTIKYVVEQQDDESEAAAFVRVLWQANYLVGPDTSRYDKERVQIGVEAGDKYEDHTAASHTTTDTLDNVFGREGEHRLIGGSYYILEDDGKWHITGAKDEDDT